MERVSGHKRRALGLRSTAEQWNESAEQWNESVVIILLTELILVTMLRVVTDDVSLRDAVTRCNGTG